MLSLVRKKVSWCNVDLSATVNVVDILDAGWHDRLIINAAIDCIGQLLVPGATQAIVEVRVGF